MSNYIHDEVLIDYLAGQVTDEVAKQVDIAAKLDPELANRLTTLQELYQGYTQLPEVEPSVAADQRFHDFLEAATQQQQSAKPRQLWRPLAAAATILLVFSIGWFGGQLGKKQTDTALAANRALMLELMKNDRTSERIRATTVALEAGKTDTTLVDNLIYLLQKDENTNVRLAALNALLRFTDQPNVQDAMLTTIDSEGPLIVKIQLIETLVRLEDERLLPYLKSLEEDDSIPLQLRDAAKLATFKLS